MHGHFLPVSDTEFVLFDVHSPFLPVSDTEEVFDVEGVSSDAVRRAVVPAVASLDFVPEPRRHFHRLLGLVLTRKNHPRFCTNQVLRGAGLLHPLQGDAAEDLGD